MAGKTEAFWQKKSCQHIIRCLQQPGHIRIDINNHRAKQLLGSLEQKRQDAASTIQLKWDKDVEQRKA